MLEGQLAREGVSTELSGGLDPRNISPYELLEITQSLGAPADLVRRWMGAVVSRGELLPSLWRSAGVLSRYLSGHVTELPRLTLESTQVSPIDGFQKLLFRTHDDLAIETVLIPLQTSSRVTICLSSQVGCVMGCTFCATARMPKRRNLAAWEIVDQFTQARLLARSQGRRVTGAVFMGMGEPFLNYERVLIAADILRFPLEGSISGKAITISTVGLVQEIRRFAYAKLPYRLSISLGAATDEKRAKLVPVAAKTPVKEVIAAAREFALIRQDRVNLAYVCIHGENVGEEDARALGELIGDTPVRLDLIDVTDGTGRYQKPLPEELKAFRDALTRYVKQPVARRYSGGADIQAACGTLAG